MESLAGLRMSVTDAVKTSTRFTYEDVIVVIVYFLVVIAVGIYVRLFRLYVH